MTVRKIYFDMDGVLANFEKMAAQTLKTHHWSKHDDAHWAVWDKIPRLFYSLEPLKEGVDLFHNVVRVFGEDTVEVLTAVPNPTGLLSTAAQDKEDWFREHVNTNVKVNTVRGGKNKVLWLKDNPGAVLIDDYERNIDLWNQHGGIGIMYVDAASTIAKMRVAGIFGSL